MRILVAIVHTRIQWAHSFSTSALGWRLFSCYCTMNVPIRFIRRRTERMKSRKTSLRLLPSIANIINDQVSVEMRTHGKKRTERKIVGRKEQQRNANSSKIVTQRTLKNATPSFLNHSSVKIAGIILLCVCVCVWATCRVTHEWMVMPIRDVNMCIRAKPWIL